MFETKDCKQEYRCRVCKSNASEFEVQNIITVDNYGRMVSPRTKKRVVCAACQSPSIIVRLDPSIVREEILNNQEQNYDNEVYVQESEPEKNTIVLNYNADDRTELSLNAKAPITKLEAFRKKVSGF